MFAVLENLDSSAEDFEAAEAADVAEVVINDENELDEATTAERNNPEDSDIGDEWG